MNLSEYSNERLHEETKSAADRERLATIEVLWHLRENERRMLYAKMGYRDLKEYCVKELKFSEGSAWRRISAMRLLKELPAIQDKIQSGDLNLTQISMAQAHFRESKPTREEKQILLSNLENQSTRATERILAEVKPEASSPTPLVKEKSMRGQKLEVTLILDEDFLRELEELQILLGKTSTKLELFKFLARDKLAALQSRAKQVRDAQPAPVPTRYIPKATRQFLKLRDNYRCQFRDPNSNRQCEARHQLQIEHIRPFAKGGKSNSENLELLCPTHNKLRAVEQYGADKMAKFIGSLR